MEEITKEMRNGEYVYLNGRGEEIGTYTDDLDNIISLQLGPLLNFLDMDIDEHESAETIQVIAKQLLKQAENKIIEVVRYIDKKHGKVDIVRARYNQGVEPEAMLDIVFKPCPDAPEAG